MKLDILVFAAHPDDAELSCGGTIVTHIKQGKKVGIVDLTQGEMGTRGTPEIRLQEASRSAKILGLSARENLYLDDIFFLNDKKNQIALIRMIRKYQPELVLANAISDRHPDHGRAAELTTQACFMSGLKKLKTELDGEDQTAWRPSAVYHYIQSNFLVPDILVDISDTWDQKMAAIEAFRSQFYNPDSNEPETFISSPQFLELIEARATEFGKSINVKYAEGFTVERNVGTKNLFNLI